MAPLGAVASANLLLCSMILACCADHIWSDVSSVFHHDAQHVCCSHCGLVLGLGYLVFCTMLPCLGLILVTGD